MSRVPSRATCWRSGFSPSISLSTTATTAAAGSCRRTATARCAFFGSMGVAPAPELGRVSSNPPGRHAGNLDNRELGVGSTLYIPVIAPGALFEVGDGHAAQGDGEV